LWLLVPFVVHKQWVWLALDVATREIIGCFIGDRSKASAQGLWESLPAVYRQCAVIYTDDWEAYKSVLPSKRQMPSATLRERVVGKETGLTSYIERFNNTLRQRVSRLSSFVTTFGHHLHLFYYSSGNKLLFLYPGSK
jgi:insertion element IS1 protein InsB